MGLFRRCVGSGNHVRSLHALIIKTKLRDPHPLQIKKRKYQNNLVRDIWTSHLISNTPLVTLIL